MARSRVYSDEQCDVALAFLKAYGGDVAKAARGAGVEQAALTLWAKGGREGVQTDADDLPPLPQEPGRLNRPQPPEPLTGEERYPEIWSPAPEVWEWAMATFVAEGAPLYNEDHWHLALAHVGVLWTNAQNAKGNSQVVGTCELGSGGGSAWGKSRWQWQLKQWFGGSVPTFLITLDAPYCAQASDARFCALVEHEMYHAAIKTVFDSPVFGKDGEPSFRLAGHDIEEFLGVYKRYGAANGAGASAQLPAILSRRPRFDDEEIETACCGCGGAV